MIMLGCSFDSKYIQYTSLWEHLPIWLLQYFKVKQFSCSTALENYTIIITRWTSQQQNDQI